MSYLSLLSYYFFHTLSFFRHVNARAVFFCLTFPSSAPSGSVIYWLFLSYRVLLRLILYYPVLVCYVRDLVSPCLFRCSLVFFCIVLSSSDCSGLVLTFPALCCSVLSSAICSCLLMPCHLFFFDISYFILPWLLLTCFIQSWRIPSFLDLFWSFFVLYCIFFLFLLSFLVMSCLDPLGSSRSRLNLP